MSEGLAVRVVLIEDQELVRSGFKMILERAGAEVVGEAADGEEALALLRGLPTERSPHVALMDIQMPRMNGIEATREALRVFPQMKVVALTTFDLDEYLYEAVRAGASGFLLKHVSPEDLVHAVRAVVQGDTILSPALTKRLLQRFATRPLRGRMPARLSALSERELEVVRLVARGLSNREIARQLFLSEATIKTYLSRLLAKLDIRDRVQVAIVAYESGLIEPGVDESDLAK